MSYIKKDFIDKIIEETNILDVIQDYVEIKKKGANYFGLSPFTKEETPSFCININTNRFSDYSSGKSGNVVNFLMENNNISFVEAIEYLAQKKGVSVEYESEKTSKKRIEKIKKEKSLRPILKSAINQYQKAYRNLPAQHPAIQEIEGKRRYSKEIVNDWQIGYSPGKNFLYNKTKESAVVSEASQLGLVNKDKKCDKYWERVIYPIHNAHGLLIGLAGRDISNNEKSSKWINSSTNDLYDKSKTWFALHRAKKEIAKKNEVWIVEGYNDVIAWHTHNLINTVSPCGTSITKNHISTLKRYCNKVILCMDGDAPGAKAALKIIPEFLIAGFRVSLIKLNGNDPDDFSRENIKEIEKQGLENFINSLNIKISGFEALLNHHITGDTEEKSLGAKNITKIIAKVSDEFLAETYLDLLKKKSGLTLTSLKKWVASERKEAPKSVAQLIENNQFELPKELDLKVDDVKSDILKYGLFMAKNQIWFVIESSSNKNYFKSISNFSIEIIQHMNDEKFPMKLVRISNIHGEKSIFDTKSENLNSLQRFDNEMTNKGNFMFNGKLPEFNKLRSYLFDKMGKGRKVEVMGWQPEGFWVWNNRVNDTKNFIEINEDGIFNLNNISYYVPSANSIYKSNSFMFDAQKKVISKRSDITFSEYTKKMLEVHREYAITAILFTIASVFQDFITGLNKNFPILFLYGPPSSGKDQLIECCMSFFGETQTAINLEGGLSTDKAKIREFAQFSGIISHLSEYKRGDSKQDGILKGLWDRRGYKRGNLDGHVTTESIPILSSVAITGNDYPDNEALITRFLWLEMVKDKFNSEEIKKYEELEDMTKKGISHFTDTILKLRNNFKLGFKKAYRDSKDTIGCELPNTNSRIISNLSVLGATYELTKNNLQFPFSREQMISHFKLSTTNQTNKLNSANSLTKWWDCFLASLRGHKEDCILVGTDLKLLQNELTFNFTQCYMKIQRQWYAQYKESAPAKNIMMDLIKKDTSWIKQVKSVRMANGSNAKNTSAYILNIEEVVIGNDLKEEITRQQEFINPNSQNDYGNSKKDDLPF